VHHHLVKVVVLLLLPEPLVIERAYPFEVGLVVFLGEGLEEDLDAQVLEVVGLQRE